MDLKGKQVALLGFGMENRALLPYFLKNGAKVTICDQNSTLPRTENNVAYQLGPDYLENLSRFDMVFRSPGIPFNSSPIQKAITDGVEVSSTTKIFFETCPAKIIGVTGTKGKGTTASLIFEILKTAKNKGEIKGEVFLVGNIGIPASSILEKVQASDWVVYELSSFQLQDLTQSPHIAVVLPIVSDHLNHHKSFEEYKESKLNILKHQSKNDYVVLSREQENLAEIAPAKVLFYDDETLPENSLATLYKINILAAVTAAKSAGVSARSIAEATANFKGLPHRLEFVAEVEGVKYYDDSFATMPKATMGALSVFKEPVVLIVGGSSKGANFSELVRSINNSTVKAAVCIGQEGEQIKKLLAAAGFSKVASGGNSMAEIVQAAANFAEPGDVVLLSPAAASFDMFKSSTDRGEQFREAVQQLE